MRRSSIREPPSALSIRLDTLASCYVKMRCLSKDYGELLSFTESSMTEPSKKRRRKGKQAVAAPEATAATTPAASAPPTVSTPPTAIPGPASAPQAATPAAPDPHRQSPAQAGPSPRL